MNKKFTPSFKWNLSDLKKVKGNNLKVFSCFACGGGSTMGYKLAGFTVIGANEIDPEMAWHYKNNHKPKHYFLEDIRLFRKRDDLPKELFNLDILDGSPPCSSFSMAGAREDGWGKNKKFREGQSEQILDDLFFDFIKLAEKLKPKVVIAENVKGMLAGNARGYVKQVIKDFSDIGYNVQLFLLNSASMGVPQRRERVFFICSRKDLKLSKLELNFNQKMIPMSVVVNDKTIKHMGKPLSESFAKWWKKCAPGKAFSSVHPRGSYFNSFKLSPDIPANTITATGGAVQALWNESRCLSDDEILLTGSYPLDYKFSGRVEVKYLIGMSVPPLMTYGVASEIYKQWFTKKPKGKSCHSTKSQLKKDLAPTKGQQKKPSLSSVPSRKKR